MTGSDLVRPAGVVPPDSAPEDPRLGHLLGRDVGPERPPRAVLVGFPSDEGVRRNGGRPGAASGPDEIRRRLFAFTPRSGAEDGEGMAELLRRTRDLGNVEVTGRVEDDQERLGAVLAPHLERGAFAMILGGGHETSYGHFLGHVGAGLEPRILNWDAHPDVREVGEAGPHSGSPFRQALLHPSGACRGYRVAGLLPHSVARAHLRFLRERGAGWLWRAEVDGPAVEEEFAVLDAPALVSFDLDVVDQAHAPGVSAPAAGGLGLAPWLRAARLAGSSPEVASVDVVELNPRFDRDDQTARLAALTVWRVLAGLAEREGGSSV